MPEFVSVENVRISLLPATLFQRFAAITIDIIFTLIFLGISALVGSSFIRSGDEWMIVLYCLFFFFLPVLEEITFNGRTIGKLCLRLRVVQIDGSAPTVFPFVDRCFRQFRQRIVVDLRHEVAPSLGRFGRRHVCGAKRFELRQPLSAARFR